MTAAAFKAEALRILDGLPDSATILCGWYYGTGGKPERPMTRSEVRGEIMAGRFTSSQMALSASLARQAAADVTEDQARQRRASMRLV